MEKTNVNFTEYIEKEIKKYEGVIFPVEASPLERMMVRTAKIKQIHPNPDDEFCDPAIGPSYRIINDYTKQFLRMKQMEEKPDEPLIVQKAHPDGYMLLNGHHRWAAAIRTDFEPLPISIVNLTQETDIRRMIRESRHDKRATMDLDEVVFCSAEDEPAEKALPFPLNQIFKERVRRGVLSLIHYLDQSGYDVWVYTNQYYSIDYISTFFKRYSVKVDGIITGAARKYKYSTEMQRRMEELISNQYKATLHISRDMVLYTTRETKKYQDYAVDPNSSRWVLDVVKHIKRIEKNGN